MNNDLSMKFSIIFFIIHRDTIVHKFNFNLV